jgi:hypothetical protein
MSDEGRSLVFASVGLGRVFMIYLPHRVTAIYKRNARFRLVIKRTRKGFVRIQSVLQGSSGRIALRGA